MQSFMIGDTLLTFAYSHHNQISHLELCANAICLFPI